MAPESNNVEYKSTWRDEYLKWICGFANAHGGKIFIGVDDNKNIVGIADCKKLMDDIPNKTINHLGLVVDVNLLHKNGNNYIEVDVPVSSVPISFHGTYYYRSGSTKQELKGGSLQEFLLRKVGRTWDDLPATATSEIIDESALAYFVKLALKSGRIPLDAEKYDTIHLLENLRLIAGGGTLKNAALLLFSKDPMKFFISCYFKIGRFGNSDSDLKFQDTIEGNIFEMADKVIDRLKEKYLVSNISYEGIHRIETLEYPEPALREAIINAIVHRDYTDGSTIQLSVYDDKLILWNPGKLPSDITVEKLKEKHPSRPRNKNIAEIFFRSGQIESWGRGIDKIMDAFKAAGLPEPVFEELAGGVQITLSKDIYNKESMQKFNLNDRQEHTIQYLKTNKSINNTDYQNLNKVSHRTAVRDLQELVEKQLVEKIGTTGKGTSYVLKNTNVPNVP